MKIIVQKFGGTSLTNEEKRNAVIDKIENCIRNGFFPVIVVSAIGRSGDPYATDTLMKFSKSCSTESTSRDLDLLISCGEVISSVMISTALKSRGYKSVALTGWQAGIITDNNFGNAKVLRVDTKNIYKYIDDNIIPVITGFQGITEEGDVTTLGRGGSDTTGCIIGEALKSEVVEIYTDVDGIMTADPKIVPNAKIMNTILYDDVYQMAKYGAKVIHPRAVQVAMRSNLPLLIKNTMSDSPGTLITSYDKSKLNISSNKSRIATSITNRSKSFVIIMSSGSKNELKKDNILFEMLATKNIIINKVDLSYERIIFIVENYHIDILYELLSAKGYEFNIIKNCSEITILGIKMNYTSMILEKTVSVLSINKIPLLHTSHSSSTISYLINTEYEKLAITSLHDVLQLNEM